MDNNIQRVLNSNGVNFNCAAGASNLGCSLVLNSNGVNFNELGRVNAEKPNLF